MLQKSSHYTGAYQGGFGAPLGLLSKGLKKGKGEREKIGEKREKEIRIDGEQEKTNKK